MYILAIETTGKVQSVSLLDLDTNSIVDTIKSEEERSHLKMLVPMIKDVLDRNNIKKSELKYVAVSIGPGSFTGIRIGVATARAISQSLNINIIPVPTLESFMYKKEVSDINAVLIYARRRQVYGFIKDKDKYILEPNLYMLDDILENTKGLNDIKIFGDGIDFYESELGDSRFLYATDKYQSSIDIAKYAYDNLDLAVGYNDVHPMYMKEAEAAEKLKKGELKISHMRQD